jgi:preprotein translocase subunit SecE
MNKFLQKIKDSFQSSVEFIRDVRKELKNVTWPARPELVGTTIVVIVAVFFFGFFLYLVDIVVNFGMKNLFDRFTR